MAISTAVRERIERFYGRDVDGRPSAGRRRTTSIRRADKEPGRFLWAHRLVSYKRPEAVVEAFRGLPYRLTMVGVGPLEKSLRETLPDNVELLGWLSREELARRYERAAGFIHVGEEDFGITMAESLAAGTPVIALDGGGARDIVRPGEDGLLIPDAEPETIRAAVRSWPSGRGTPARSRAAPPSSPGSASSRRCSTSSGASRPRTAWPGRARPT